MECNNCNGKGKIVRKCRICLGRGGWEDPDQGQWVTHKDCNGTGQYEDVCIVCSGTGKIPDPEPPSRIEKKKEAFWNTLAATVSDFLYYDRDGDEELSVEDIRVLIEEKHIKPEEIVDYFQRYLGEAIQANFDLEKS